MSLRFFSLAAAAFVVAALGCTDSQPTGLTDVDPSYVKGGAGPTVDAAEPNTASPDTTLDVRVIGTGFEEGSAVTFLSLAV